jgi:enoyl-CoA hydratase/carnithine racemase
LVQLIVESPPGALAALKKLLRASASASLESQMAAEAEAISTLAASPATLQRLQEFMNRKG